MIISLKNEPNRKYFVYAMYWGHNFKEYLRYHYVIEPEEIVGGFLALGENEIEVVDASVNNYILIRQGGNGNDLLLHETALPVESLYEQLNNGGYPDKVEQLYSNMRRMGLDPEPK